MVDAEATVLCVLNTARDAAAVANYEDCRTETLDQAPEGVVKRVQEANGSGSRPRPASVPSLKYYGRWASVGDAFDNCGCPDCQ